MNAIVKFDPKTFTAVVEKMQRTNAAAKATALDQAIAKAGATLAKLETLEQESRDLQNRHHNLINEQQQAFYQTRDAAGRVRLDLSRAARVKENDQQRIAKAEAVVAARLAHGKALARAKKLSDAT
jgi:hypothetical protein